MASLFEQILSVKGYPISKAKAWLKEYSRWTADERNDWQEKKRRTIVEYHYKQNEFYKNYVKGKLPDSWEDIPIITKADLQRPLSELISKGVDLQKCYRGSTSGSTGTPFSFAKDKLTHAMTWAVIAEKYLEWGIGFQSKQARFYGMPKEFAANRKELLKDRLMNRERFSVFDWSDEQMQNTFDRFTKKRFDYLYGYTSALVMFARYLIEQSIVLKEVCPSIKVCICTSETCSVEDKEILERALGVSVVREYGLSETCITAFDTKEKGWLLNDSTLYTEVVDGQIITTSLFNVAMPMVRYATGDMGAISRNKDGYRNLEKLNGRTNDVILLPDGKKAAGLSFYYVARSVLEQTDVLKEFIIRQTAINQFDFDVVAKRPLSIDEVELLQNKTREYLSTDVNVNIHQLEKIQRPESGKLKNFYSEIRE